MTKYLLLYRSSVSADDAMANATPEQAQAGMEAWMNWAGRAGSALVDLGAPVAESAQVGRGDGAITGFSILETETTDELLTLLEEHPHLRTPGDSAIEALEFLPVPGAPD
jgi:hypothetical protein